MEPRFQRRKEQLLADCQVPPTTFRGAIRRLEAFAPPFVAALPSPEGQQYTGTDRAGLLSDLEPKDAEAIAYRNDRDGPTLRAFVGASPRDHTPLIAELNRQLAVALGRPDAVLVFDPAAFPKQGTASVGVQRQWWGRLGKVENCPVGVSLGYVTGAAHVLVDSRLYLPREWAKDKARRKRCGAPQGVGSRTRPALALERLDRRGQTPPHGWVSGDDARGRPAWPGARPAARRERYPLAVPSNPSLRDREAEPPPYGGRGRHPKPPFRGMRAWCEARPAGAWTRLSVRDGETGPRDVAIVVRRGESKGERRVVGLEETRVVVRYEEGGQLKSDYHLPDAEGTTSLEELARVAKAGHRIEGCLKRGKSEAGLGDYQVRDWLGWHHPLALSLIATWSLVGEARRGKKEGPGVDGATSACGAGADLSQGVPVRS